MSTDVKVSADTPISVSASRNHQYLWTTVLILSVIAACGMAAWFYADMLPVEASMIGP